MPIVISQDHLGPSWGSSGVLGGFQTENTQNMGKYQKLEIEKIVKFKSFLTKVPRYAYNYTPRQSGTILGSPRGS